MGTNAPPVIERHWEPSGCGSWLYSWAGGVKGRVIARGWAEEVARAIRRGPEVLGERYTEVRYEALIARPEEELRRLLAFLGANASEEAAKGCVESAGSGRLSEKKAAGRCEVFTGRDRRVFKEEAGELLVRLGYEEDGDW